ncbi:M4 family metallopeptidase [Leifsonia flava]|uniref:Neutral metalloproteinase n=1 Tax=Orlajensenia leifsoniae TaxID=2561933 RepID=A0A4Y9R244_9MICO|nr:M4 family metallopeptidase [Leifsonia flava]TFV98709.1 M4 family peptidase [Leifsonia flava]
MNRGNDTHDIRSHATTDAEGRSAVGIHDGADRAREGVAGTHAGAARIPRHHSIVPPYLLAAIAATDDPRFQNASHAAKVSLVRDGVRFDEPNPLTRNPQPRSARPRSATPGLPERTIADAQGRETLPGEVVRREGEPPTDDVSVNEAYDGLGATFELFWDVYNRDSIDGKGLPLDATVHYGEQYDNAFWDGERMVFGDGDGEVFTRFTIAIDVIGHELTHGVTQFTANLVYEGQSGALNESVSDVFGSLVAQFAKRQTADQASWLIGEGLFTDEVQGIALRSLKAPGTAYDDDVLGKDPQPAHMRDYDDTTADSGGVHINSGIPNHAFYLVATAIGGAAWEKAGQIWYDALTGDDLAARADFSRFAKVTTDAAARRYGDDAAETDAVRAAWLAVGVVADE